MAKREAIQGYLFETFVKDLVKKAGFNPDVKSQQITKSGRFRGRGATHQIDVYGEFRFTIPFIYPINIIGEAKGYSKGRVSLNVARSFCGVIKDVQEWYHIDTTKGGLTRFERVGEKRFNHCGAIFSLTGFSKPAIEYCWAQGIYPISYENNPIILKMMSNFKKLSNEVRITDLSKGVKKSFKNKSLDELYKIVDNKAKYKNFDKKLGFIIKELDNIYSYFGMLNGRFVCNIISNTKLLDEYKDEKLIVKYRDIFKLYTTNNVFLGYFSLPNQFLSIYLQSIKNIKKMFGYIDIFFTDKQNLNVRKFLFETQSIENLANKLPKYLELQKQKEDK